MNEAFVRAACCLHCQLHFPLEDVGPCPVCQLPACEECVADCVMTPRQADLARMAAHDALCSLPHCTSPNSCRRYQRCADSKAFLWVTAQSRAEESP